MESFQGCGFTDDTQDYVNQKDFVPTVLSPPAYRGTHSDNSCGNEKLNPETMECLWGFGITRDRQEQVNQQHIVSECLPCHQFRQYVWSLKA